jgi:hypothetical protein
LETPWQYLAPAESGLFLNGSVQHTCPEPLPEEALQGHTPFVVNKLFLRMFSFSYLFLTFYESVFRFGMIRIKNSNTLSSSKTVYSSFTRSGVGTGMAFDLPGFRACRKHWWVLVSLCLYSV